MAEPSVLTATASGRRPRGTGGGGGIPPPCANGGTGGGRIAPGNDVTGITQSAGVTIVSLSSPN